MRGAKNIGIRTEGRIICFGDLMGFKASVYMKQDITICRFGTLYPFFFLPCLQCWISAMCPRDLGMIVGCSVLALPPICISLVSLLVLMVLIPQSTSQILREAFLVRRHSSKVFTCQICVCFSFRIHFLWASSTVKQLMQYKCKADLENLGKTIMRQI